MKPDKYEVVYEIPATGITDMRIFTSLGELSEWMNLHNNNVNFDPVKITDIRRFTQNLPCK